ncbi:transglycosylase domain-containing protein [Mesorhizobium atlanticum]
MLMAVAIQRHFSKSKILELYVENAYFGWRGQGIVEICHRLGFEVGSLNVSQAALIAALIKLPLPKTPSRSLTSIALIEGSGAFVIRSRARRENDGGGGLEQVASVALSGTILLSQIFQAV